MVRDLFISKLADHGVYRLEANGQLFDPAKHEALTVAPLAPGQVDGQIVSVIRQGYSIGQEVLRPAGVAVAQKQYPNA
jgi:molecular chaperone GrpE